MTYGRRETVRDAAIDVRAPTRPTEFELQATVWSGLRAIGIDARGEVRCAFAGRAQVRFDIAVFCGERLAGIVEVKASPDKDVERWQSTRQGQRYAQFGVPVHIVCGADQVKAFLLRAAAGELWPLPAP